MLLAVGQADPLEQIREERRVGLLAGDRERQEDVLLGRQHRQQVEELEHEPDVLTAQHRDVAVAQSEPSTWPAIQTLPLVGLSSAASRCISVDFPDPDGPITATSSPGCTSIETPRSASTAVSPSP